MTAKKKPAKPANTRRKKQVSNTIERKAMLTHLEGYRKYLRKLLKEQDGADTSVYKFQGAISAVNNLIREVKKEEV